LGTRMWRSCWVRWRWWGDPEPVKREVGQMVEVGGDAGEVAGTVVCGAGETTDVDLVESGIAPPERLGGGSWYNCTV
jgi:hypothetical protein